MDQHKDKPVEPPLLSTSDGDESEESLSKGDSARLDQVTKSFWRKLSRWLPFGLKRLKVGRHKLLSVALVLPGGARLLLVTKPRPQRKDGWLELDIAPTPANEERVLAALKSVSQGGRKRIDPRLLLEQLRAKREGKSSAIPNQEREYGQPLIFSTIEKKEQASNISSNEHPGSCSSTINDKIDCPSNLNNEATNQNIINLGLKELSDVSSHSLSLLDDAEVSGAAPKATVNSSKNFIPILGIDFGTTYSAIAIMRNDLEVIPDEHNEIQLPSIISFPHPGEVILGREARARLAGEAQWTITSPKRLLGRLYKDPQVVRLVGGLALRSFAGSDRFSRFEAHGQIYSVSDICGMILGSLRERACRFLNAEVSKVVLTIPIGFDTSQRSALELAARQAGLEVMGMIPEPSAGALYYGFRDLQAVIAIYDFGGGTFDFSLLEVNAKAFRVLCSGSDDWLGGDDFDQLLANQLADRFWKEAGVDIRHRAVEWQALIFACEKAKRDLSTKSTAEIKLNNLLFTAQGPKGLYSKISRKDFIRLTEPLIQRSLEIVDQVLKQAAMPVNKVDYVVMVGGTSLIPAVKTAVACYFGKTPLVSEPELAVVKGATIRAAEIFDAPIVDNYLLGRRLHDVVGRTIGVGEKNGSIERLFERYTPLPARAQRSFYTTTDGQTEMVILLYEDARQQIDEKRIVGQLHYSELPAAPAGQCRIDVLFTLDEKGSLQTSTSINGKYVATCLRLE